MDVLESSDYDPILYCDCGERLYYASGELATGYVPPEVQLICAAGHVQPVETQ